MNRLDKLTEEIKKALIIGSNYYNNDENIYVNTEVNMDYVTEDSLSDFDIKVKKNKDILPHILFDEDKLEQEIKLEDEIRELEKLLNIKIEQLQEFRN